MKTKMIDVLLNQLKLRGLEVKYQDEQTLTLAGPGKEKTPEVIAAVKAFKPQLIEHLRPRDMTLKRYDVHHEPPTCSECKSHVWDKEETGMICESSTCPMKKR